MTRLLCCALPLFLLFLSLPERALAEGPGMLFHGSSEQGVEFRIEADETGDGLFLRLFRRDGQGRFEPLVPSTRFLPTMHTPLGFEGIAFVRGRLLRVRISLSQDDETLRWLEPATLSLSDGTDIRMAGDYARHPDEQLLSDAKISWSRADALLNDEYNRLRNSLPKQTLELLQANQRLWLKYRDDYIADGDDMEQNGPGSMNFLRIQTERTLNRTAFLQVLAGAESRATGLEGIYSDGIDRELVVSAAPGRGLLCLLRSELPHLYDRSWQEPIAFTGRAEPVEGSKIWRLRVESRTGMPETGVMQELFLEPASDGAGMLVSVPTHTPFSGLFFRVGDAGPDRESLRRVLLRLPAKVFDFTTEGLDDESKNHLANHGLAEPFHIEEETLDYLMISYRDGQVCLRRFPASDGSAVVACVTQNGRSNSFELWRVPSDGTAPYILPSEQVFARLDDIGGSPYPDPRSGEIGYLYYSLRPDLAELHMEWTNQETSENFSLNLGWDGWGFVPTDMANVF